MEEKSFMWSKGFVKIIALMLINERPMYGNEISNEIFERTNGMWKPGPGSIYPALNRLTKVGYAESYNENDRVVYKITEKGKEKLKEISENRIMNNSPMHRFLGKLWVGVMNPEGRSRFIISSVQNSLISLESLMDEFENAPEHRDQLESLMLDIEVELEKAIKRIENLRKKIQIDEQVD